MRRLRKKSLARKALIISASVIAFPSILFIVFSQIDNFRNLRELERQKLQSIVEVHAHHIASVVQQIDAGRLGAFSSARKRISHEVEGYLKSWNRTAPNAFVSQLSTYMASEAPEEVVATGLRWPNGDFTLITGPADAVDWIVSPISDRPFDYAGITGIAVSTRYSAYAQISNPLLTSADEAVARIEIYYNVDFYDRVIKSLPDYEEPINFYWGGYTPVVSDSEFLSNNHVENIQFTFVAKSILQGISAAALSEISTDVDREEMLNSLLNRGGLGGNMLVARATIPSVNWFIAATEDYSNVYSLWLKETLGDIALVLGVLLGLFIVYFREIIRPIERLESRVNTKAAEYKLLERNGNNEIDRLDNVFDQLFNVLEENLKSKTSMLASAEEQLEVERRLAKISEHVEQVCHDIKTPINGAALVVDQLAMDLRSEAAGANSFLNEAPQSLSDVNRQLAVAIELANKLMGTVHDARTGEKQEICPTDEILAAQKMTALGLQKAGVELALNLPSYRLPLIRGPRSALSVALSLLIENARNALVEHNSATKRIAISANIEEIPGESTILAITVIDSGPGMDDETIVRAKDRLFTSRQGRGGTGLGLHNANEYISNFGGTLTLTSPPGSGLAIFIRIPILVHTTRKTVPQPSAAEKQRQARRKAARRIPMRHQR